jgi:ligand-binding sensor domain-containing protein
MDQTGTLWMANTAIRPNFSAFIVSFDGQAWTSSNDINRDVSADGGRFLGIDLKNMKPWFINRSALLTLADIATIHQYTSDNIATAPANREIYLSANFDKNSMLQSDSHGNIWFKRGGTSISRYDWNTWTVFNTPDSGFGNANISGMAVDKNDRVWVQSSSTVCDCCSVYMDRENLYWFDGTEWSKPSGVPLPSNYSTIVTDVDGNLWFTMTDNNTPVIARYDGTACETFDSSAIGWNIGNLYSCVSTPDNSHWFIVSTGGAARGILRYASGTWKLFTDSNSGLSSNKITSIAPDHQNRLWIATEDLGLACLLPDAVYSRQQLIKKKKGLSKS